MRRAASISVWFAVAALLACAVPALAGAAVTRTGGALRRAGTLSGARIDANLSSRRSGGDPAANRTPSDPTLQACADAPLGSACETLALADINAARAAEGVAPMVLPEGFGSLTVPQQMLVVANLERVARGLTPASGLANSLDQAAVAGAAADLDPNPGVVKGDVMASNWAGGSGSPLLVDFLWMYDDGPGSDNIECTSAGDSGCWGHRENILYPFDPPVAMGAADVPGTSYGESLTELFIGGDLATAPGETDAPLAPAWSTLSQSLRPTVSTTAVQLVHGSRSAELQLSGSVASMAVQAAITQGSGWQVTPSACLLTASSSCRLTVTRTGGGGATGTLTVSGPAGSTSISLASQASARLSLHVSKRTLRKGAAATVRGRLTLPNGASPAGALVLLLTRRAGAGAPVVLARALTTARGSVRFRVKPRATTRYELAFAGSPTLSAAISPAAAIRVR